MQNSRHLGGTFWFVCETSSEDFCTDFIIYGRGSAVLTKLVLLFSFERSDVT